MILLIGLLTAFSLSCGRYGWGPDPVGTADRYPRWSAYSGQIAFLHVSYGVPDSLPMGLYVTDTLSRSRRLLVEDLVFGFDWMPGTDSLVVRTGSGLKLISAATGTGIPVVPGVDGGLLRISPSGERIAFSGTHDGRSALFIYDRTTGRTRLATPDSLLVGNLSWGPSEDRLVVIAGSTHQYGVMLVDSSGVPVRMLAQGWSEYRGVDWARDGARVLFEATNPGGRIAVMVTDTLGATPREVANSVDGACWSPNGDVILYAAPTEEGHSTTLTMLRLADGTRERLFR